MLKLQFEDEMNVDLNELETNLVPLARVHDITTSMAPVLRKEKAESEKNDVPSISELCVLFFYLFILCTWLFATD